MIGALLSLLAVVVPQPASAAHGGLHWGVCPTYLYPDLRGGGEQCTHISVPLDYSHRGGAHISLELSRVQIGRASCTERR